MQFARQSKDLYSLSVPDVAVVSLAYELLEKKGLKAKLNSKPPKIDVKTKPIVKKPAPKNKKKVIIEPFSSDEDEPKKEEVKQEEVPQKPKEQPKQEEEEDEWIGPSNLEEKLEMNKTLGETQNLPVEVVSNDFALQNLCLKLKIPIESVEGMRIKCIRYYLLKCYTCNKFEFDTSKRFCSECSYDTLMKIGYTLDENGRMTVNDKEAEARLRGTQFDLPKPSLDKKGVVYITSEDMIPRKMRSEKETNFDKLIEMYEDTANLGKRKEEVKVNSSKTFVFANTKKNPNQAKKYYGKKSKR